MGNSKQIHILLPLENIAVCSGLLKSVICLPFCVACYVRVLPTSALHSGRECDFGNYINIRMKMFVNSLLFCCVWIKIHFEIAFFKNSFFWLLLLL